MLNLYSLKTLVDSDLLLIVFQISFIDFIARSTKLSVNEETTSKEVKLKFVFEKLMKMLFGEADWFVPCRAVSVA